MFRASSMGAGCLAGCFEAAREWRIWSACASSQPWPVFHFLFCYFDFLWGFCGIFYLCEQKLWCHFSVEKPQCYVDFSSHYFAVFETSLCFHCYVCVLCNKTTNLSKIGLQIWKQKTHKLQHHNSSNPGWGALLNVYKERFSSDSITPRG